MIQTFAPVCGRVSWLPKKEVVNHVLYVADHITYGVLRQLATAGTKRVQD